MKLHTKGTTQRIKKNILAAGNIIYVIIHQMFNVGRIIFKAHHNFMLIN
jgi:hypothetical protein